MRARPGVGDLVLRGGAAVLLALAWGCSSPSGANIQLRKENQRLGERIAELEKAREGDAATIRALEQRSGTLQTLPKDRLDRLFTVHGLTLGRLTGGWDSDSSKPGDEGIKVYAAPVDAEGETLKEAGTFVVEAFDLANTASPLVGKWEFDVAAAREAWNGSALSNQYVLKCPWQGGPPGHSELTVKVTFVDELTGRRFGAQKVVGVKLPVGSAVELAVRADDVTLARDRGSRALVLARHFQGAQNVYRVRLPSGRLLHSLQPHTLIWPPGTPVRVISEAGHALACFHEGRLVSTE